jgi:hypothetical protein
MFQLLSSRSPIFGEFICDGRISIRPGAFSARASAAVVIALVIFLDATGRIGVQGILGKLDVGQNHDAVDDDALGDCSITEKLDIATGIVSRHGEETYCRDRY